MALTTISFCDACKWRSSAQPMNLHIAGAPCPTCGAGTSALHCDPAYVGTDQFGRKYVEAQAINDHLAKAGVSSADPAQPVALPTHGKTP